MLFIYDLIVNKKYSTESIYLFLNPFIFLFLWYIITFIHQWIVKELQLDAFSP